MANSSTQRIGIELYQPLNLNTDVHKYNYNTLQHNTGYPTNGYLHPVEHTQTNIISVNNGEEIHSFEYDNNGIKDVMENAGLAYKYIGGPGNVTNNTIKIETSEAVSNRVVVAALNNSIIYEVEKVGKSYNVYCNNESIMTFNNVEYLNWYYDIDMVNDTNKYLAFTARNTSTSVFYTVIVRITDNQSWELTNVSFTQTGHWFFTELTQIETIYDNASHTTIYGKSFSPFFRPRFNISDNNLVLDYTYMINHNMLNSEFVVKDNYNTVDYSIDDHKYYTQINIKFSTITEGVESNIKYLSIDNARTKVIETDRIKFIGDQLPYCVIPMYNTECLVGVNGGELMYVASKDGVILSEIDNTSDVYNVYLMGYSTTKAVIRFVYNNKVYSIENADKDITSMLNKRYFLSEVYNTNNVYDVVTRGNYTFANGYLPVVEFDRLSYRNKYGSIQGNKDYATSIFSPSDNTHTISFAITYNNSPENTEIPFQSVHPAGYYQINLINTITSIATNEACIDIGNSDYEIYYDDSGSIPKYVGNNIKLKDTKYVVQTSYPLTFDDEVIDSGIGTDYVRINNVMYKLISVKGNTSSFAYSIDTYQNGRDIYFIQGQGYIDNGTIISDLNSGNTIKEITGFDYIGCDGRAAFYFSKATRQIYVFQGNQILSLYLEAGKIKEFDNFKYFPFIDRIISQCTNIDNTTSTYIYNVNGMTELEFPETYGDVGTIDYSFDDGYNVLLFNGKDTYIKEDGVITKTDTTVEGILDFNDWNGHMKLSTPWYSLLNEQRQVIDCIYIRTEHNKIHSNDNKQYLTINYQLQVDDKVVSESKTFDEFVELVKFQPKHQDVCYAIRFDIETSCAIESLTMSVIPQGDTTNMIKQTKI